MRTVQVVTSAINTQRNFLLYIRSIIIALVEGRLFVLDLRGLESLGTGFLDFGITFVVSWSFVPSRVVSCSSDKFEMQMSFPWIVHLILQL